MIMYPDDETCAEGIGPRRRDWDRNCCIFPKHPKPQKILLECGTRPQDAMFEIRNGRVRRRQKFDLDRVLIDTSCLCRPQVKIEFSCLIFFEAEADYDNSMAEAEVACRDKEIEVDLLFELVRICNGVEETVQEWRYLKEFEIESDDRLEVEISEPFTVTFCDRECPDCCVYKMTVRGRDFDGDFDALRITRPNISALAQGLCNE